ncbi:selenoprotein M precursor [Silurus asotus]|uniref:Selenoprotein M n=1 Tax=Silurus asotus TaxID=30991 RepID=A0AAD5FR45_SILAS|nr:selenoprotein M precursor [Silurus asotus]
MANMWPLLWAAFLPSIILAYEVDWKKLNGLARAKVEVKAFVTQDIPLFHNLVMKHLPGADPELVLLNHYYEELDRIPLSHMTRAEINTLLEELGFYKKAQAEDEVPEEFRFSPAKDSPFKEHHTRKPPAHTELPEEPQPEKVSPHQDL